MAATDNTPINKNFLSPLNFRFQLKRAPHVNFFIQKINLPSININETNYGNPFVKIPISGEHIDYGTLSVTFKVDEELENYLEIHNWLRGLGKPQSFKEYGDLAKQEKITGGGIASDISLIILNSTKLPNYEIVFIDSFPVSLSSLDFDTTREDVDYLEATVEFKYTLFNIEKIT
jgi:hypothetical protein